MPTHKISFAATHPRLWLREGGADQSCMRKSGFVAPERELEDSCQDPSAELFPHATDTIFLAWSAPLYTASISAEEKQQPYPRDPLLL